MARDRGTFQFSQNIEPRIKAPLDARMVVTDVSSLYDPSTWVDPSLNAWLYDGMIVGVVGDPSASLDGIYLLLDSSNYTDASSWAKMKTDAGFGDTYGENIGDGDVSIYAGKVGDALQFRELKAGAGVSFDVSDGTITIDASGSGAIYNSTLNPSLGTPDDVGGIPAGTTVYDLLGSTFTEFVDDLLFPTVNPTYVPPDNTFTDNVNYLQEIDANVPINFTATFDRGQILVSGNFQDFRSGLPNTYNYTGPGLTPSVSSTALSDLQNVNHSVVQGIQTWTNTVSYDIGPQPEDNKGNPYGSPLPAGTTGFKSTSMEGVYPLFGTTSSISDPSTKQTLVSMLTGNNIVFNMAAQPSGPPYQSFDIPNAWPNALLGVETYNTVSGSWEYEGGSAATSLTKWTTSSVTHVIQSNTINYTRYSYNGINRGAVQIRLKF